MKNKFKKDLCWNCQFSKRSTLTNNYLQCFLSPPNSDGLRSKTRPKWLCSSFVPRDSKKLEDI